jgi:hypothetical protein
LAERLDVAFVIDVIGVGTGGAANAGSLTRSRIISGGLGVTNH